MSYNYQVVLFKNKVKKKIINKFKTHKKANELYNSLVEESNTVLFDKKYENGYESLYELALLEKTSGTLLPMFMKDTFGRQVKVDLDDNDFTIIRISTYNLEELIVDYSTNTRITISDFIKKYLDPPGLKMVSKLNNKVIVQNDDHYNLFTLKNDDDSSRLLDNLSENFISKKRSDCMFVKDYSTAQRKYLYSILSEKGFPKTYLFRQSTTHPTKT
jgi:hypothetical protein